MPRMTGGQLVVASLRAHGVDTVFGIASVHMLPIYDALYDAPDVQLIVPRHEGGGTAMADGYFRATGRPGVVLTSTGPGAANSCGAMFEAYHASSKVLHITSQIPTPCLDRGKGYLHEAPGQLEMLAPLSGYRRRVTAVEEIPEAIAGAFCAFVTERPRPAVIEIPIDLQSAQAEVPLPKAEEVSPPQPDPARIEEAAALLGTARRPMIWAGGGVLTSGAWAEVSRLAERLNAPLFTTLSGRGAMPEDHPLCLGYFATAPEMRDFFASADVLLAIGTRFSAQATGQWRLSVPADLIHVDIDEANFDLNYPARVKIRADAQAALRALEACLDREVASRHDRAEISRRRAQARAAARSRLGEHEAVMDVIRATLERDAIIVRDSTIPAYYWANRLLEIYEPRTSISPHGSIAIGLGLPLAIGAKAGRPDRQVVVIHGDGGFMVHATELAAAVQHRLKVIILLFNDGGYGILRRMQDRDYNGRRIGVDLHTPDFVRLAESFGVLGLRVTAGAQVSRALEQALAAEGPTLIELQLSGLGPQSG